MSTPASRSAKAKRPTVGRMIVAKERRDRALELRIAGMSERAIAKEIGVSNGRVNQLLHEGVAELNASCMSNAEDVRRIEAERLDKIFVALFANRNDPRTADTLLRTMERRSKLFGLDAPTRQEIAGPNQGPVKVTQSLEQLTNEELEQLNQILSKAAVVEPVVKDGGE